MEYPGLCSVTAGMLIKKGGFVMCKRKIKTIEAIFFLILFSFIVLLLPQNAHARVRVVTKGTTSTIRDTDGVIEDEFSDINFPINIKNANCQKRIYAVTVRVSFYSPKGVIPKSTTFSIDGINVVKLSTSNYTPLAYKETFFTYDDNLEDGYLEFDFGNKECPVPVDCDYEVTIKQAVPEIFITNNNYLNQSIRTGKTTSIGIEISDPYVKTISKSKFKVTSSNSSVLKVQSITQDSKKRSRFTVTLKGMKAGSAKITLSYPKATACKLTGKVTSPSKTVATFRASKTTLKVGSKVSMRSLINLKGGTSLTIKNAKSSKPSVLAISGNYLVPKKKGSATVTANLNGVNRKITITVSAPAAKPTVKNLKIRVAGIKYGPNDMKTYYTLKFTNTSAKTITTAKVQIITGSGIYDQMYWTKNLTLNLKPGKAMTKTYFIQNMVQAPEKSDISVKCLKISWK